MEFQQQDSKENENFSNENVFQKEEEQVKEENFESVVVVDEEEAIDQEPLVKTPCKNPLEFNEPKETPSAKPIKAFQIGNEII